MNQHISLANYIPVSDNISIAWSNCFPALFDSLLINEESKLCLILNRKVCSSSMALVLSPRYEVAAKIMGEIAEARSVESSLEWLHGNYFLGLGFKSIRSISGSDPIKVLINNDFSFISAYRDPTDRLVSYYKAALDRKFVYGSFDDKVLVGTSFYNYFRVTSFFDFVHLVSTDFDINSCDPHWISQSRILPPFLPAIYLINQAKFGEEIDFVSNKLFGSVRSIKEVNVRNPSRHDFDSRVLSSQSLDFLRLEKNYLDSFYKSKNLLTL